MAQETTASSTTSEPEKKTRKKQKIVPVGIFESISVDQYGLVEKPLKDEAGKSLEFKSTAKADKWLKDNAKEGDNDKVFLIAPLRKVTLKATKQLKVALEY